MRETSLSALLFAVVAGPAAAQNVSADPTAVSAVLEQSGFESRWEQTPGGQPALLSSNDASDFSVFFSNCNGDGDECSTLQFYAGYQTNGRTELSAINAFNRDTRFGDAYLDEEGDAVLEMDVNLDFGGISRENLADQISVWTDLMETFETAIDW